MDTKPQGGAQPPGAPAFVAGTPPFSDQLAQFGGQVLADAALQKKLWVPDDTDRFIAMVLDVARGCGFDLDADAVRGTMEGVPRGVDARPERGWRTSPAPSPDWLPIRAFWQRDKLHVRWANFGEQLLDEPFFDGSVQRCLYKPFNRLFQFTTPIAALAEWLTIHPGLPPRGLVFHMSRCGSTLVSQLLAAPEHHVVVSEASPIDAVVQARIIQPDLADFQHAQWLAWIIGALGQPRGGARDYFIKLDSWHTLALPLFRRAFPSVPWIFLYRDPVEVVVSHVNIRGAQTVPGVLSPGVIGLEDTYQPQMTEDYIARVLARICAPVERHIAEGGGLLVNYRELPDALWTRILPHFGVACTEDNRAAMARAAQFNAKKPGVAFVRDVETKQQTATGAARAAADRHLGDVYRRLEELRARA